ncbi:MAG: sigma 54-interacting transcriptional regulator [Deltaproteobacteria bacterium]|nr:sigma 54-interacting transcriptional regulator [Deltaproteobacteria bacterium]
MSGESASTTRYRLEGLLGAGGMGAVFRAWDKERSREVAIKWLKGSASEADLRRFREEVRVLTRIHHPNLIKIYDFHPEMKAVVEGEISSIPNMMVTDSSPCFAMEYLPFPTLDQYQEPVAAESFLEIFVQALQGLHYLHSRGILHRDLKPSNVAVTGDKIVKLLDFGLAESGGDRASESRAMGTLAYQAPETYWGRHDESGDLFSLGVLSYEILTRTLPFSQALSEISQVQAPRRLASLRPDLPEYLGDLIHRMIELPAGRRPSSAASILRFLQKHLPHLPSLPEAGDGGMGLDRPNWIRRESEISALIEEWRETLAGGFPRIVELHGPTGVGRSRLLEEWLWKLRLEGHEVQTVGPEQAESWYRNSETRNPYEDLITLLKNAGKTPRWLQFTDLHAWPPVALNVLRIFLSLLGDSKLPWCCLLEWNEDLASEETRNRIRNPSLTLPWKNLPLRDLSPNQTLAFIHAALVDDPIPEPLARRIAIQSGGRPLLAIALLKEKHSQALPGTLREATRSRLTRLSAEERRLLALTLVQDEAWTTETISEATSWPAEKISELEENLEREAWIQKSGNTGGRTLRHPSLRAIIEEELSPEILGSAHHDWRVYWQKRFPEAAVGIEACYLTRHALAEADGETAKKYGFAAAEYFLLNDREGEAAEIFEKLLPGAKSPRERSYLQAQLAPLYYRQAEYEKSLEAYDRWYSEREDDASQLQKLKHCWYTALVRFSWGKTGEAGALLEEALRIGDGIRYPAHRPYLVRVHNLSAALAEKNRDEEKALSHLRQSESLAEGDPLALGEIEHRIGRWHQERLEWTEAESYYRRSLAHYQKAANPQAEGIARNALAMLHLSEGKLDEALNEISSALEASKSGRDYLQQARYRENLGLIQMARGEYGEAEAIFAESRRLLEILGQESDRLLLPLHRLQLSQLIGNMELAAYWTEAIEVRSQALRERDLLIDYRLATAEGDLLRGEASMARQKILAAFAETENHSAYDKWRVMLALLRCRWMSAGLSDFGNAGAFPDLGGPICRLWRALGDFFASPNSVQDEAALYSVLEAVRACESPELRLEGYLHLAKNLELRNLNRLAHLLREAAITEWQNLFIKLPEELQMDFEKNRGLDQLEENLQKLLPRSKAQVPGTSAAPSPASGEVQVSEARFRQFSEINRQIAEKTDLKELLERVMDAAIEFTGAERGFLLLRKAGDANDSPEGFEVQAARHLSQHNLKTDEFSLSMSAVRKAVEMGTYLLTDNARLDPRFQEKKSVVLHQLTSILVVPLEQSGKIHGAIYLDHRLQPGCFKKEDILLLNAFASQAALAIQKARLLEELQIANAKLSVEVRDQAQHIQALTGELTEARDQLRYEYSEIVGQSPQMMQVFQLLDHVTATSIPVWIWGESGTGKELVARSLHENSPRKNGPFVSENCSAIPENLLESELFGHKRGAFTHADRDRIGLLEQASGGTLFLDEVADMSLGMQAKLLRAFQEGEIRPLGSGKKVKVDVRLVTASNRDLAQMVREETFRQDLFFRINGLTVRLPPLRERKTDIPLLVEAFMKKLGKQFSLPKSEMTEAAYQAMYQYTWPGNIRELESVLRNALLFAKGRPIGPELLALNFSAAAAARPNLGAPNHSTADASDGKGQKEKILALLRTHQLDKEKVAHELGISLRSLYTWLEKMGVPKKKSLLARYLENMD